MAHQSGGGSSIVKWVVLAGGAYVGYNYLVSSGMWAQWFGPSSTPGGGGLTIPAANFPGSSIVPPQPTPPQNTTPASSTTPLSPAALASLQSQIQAAAGAGVTALDPDQWAYYYAQVRGLTGGISGLQMSAILAALNLTPATRAQTVSLAAFLGSLPAAGLSGLGATSRLAFLPIPAQAAVLRAIAERKRSTAGNYLRAGTPMLRGAA